MTWFLDHKIFQWQTMVVSIQVWKKAGLTLPKNFPFADVRIGDRFA